MAMFFVLIFRCASVKFSSLDRLVGDYRSYVPVMLQFHLNTWTDLKIRTIICGLTKDTDNFVYSQASVDKIDKLFFLVPDQPPLSCPWFPYFQESTHTH